MPAGPKTSRQGRSTLRDLSHNACSQLPVATAMATDSAPVKLTPFITASRSRFQKGSDLAIATDGVAVREGGRIQGPMKDAKGET